MFLGRYLEQEHPCICDQDPGPQSRQTRLASFPLLTESCPSGPYSATSYSGNVAKISGRKNPLPVMVLVSDGFGGLASVLVMYMGTAERKGAN